MWKSQHLHGFAALLLVLPDQSTWMSIAQILLFCLACHIGEEPKSEVLFAMFWLNGIVSVNSWIFPIMMTISWMFMVLIKLPYHIGRQLLTYVLLDTLRNMCTVTADVPTVPA